MTTFWFKALQAENISSDDEMKPIETLVEDLIRLQSSWPSLINEAHLIATGLELYGFQSNFVQKKTTL